MNGAVDLSLNSLVRQALTEDLGPRGDITSQAIFDKGSSARAVIQSKASGVCSGTKLIEPLFHSLDKSITVSVLRESAAAIEPGTRICGLSGHMHAILAGERTALNFLQHLSGVATATRFLAEKIAHTRAKLLDTRKTTPLLRALEKEAVVHGGGTNHRFGLFDMILVKHTHVKAAGSVTAALRRAQAFVKKSGLDVKIEAETQTAKEFEEALACAPQRIMLDNMSIAEMAKCVQIARAAAPGIELEASGNVTAETIVAIAETEVDFISVGAITHSAAIVDMHLLIE
jgi:nicotinate-nucleotide pyrophosphorylase (carboxylating)